MAEQEELQLRVTLDDQASSQLAALRGQLDQMRGAGSAAAQVQQAAPQIVGAIADAVQQLAAMGEQIKQLPPQIAAAMSATVQGLQQVQTQVTQMGTQIKEAAQGVATVPGHVREGIEGLGGVIRRAGFIGGFAGAAVAELGLQLAKIGTDLVQRATDFRGLSDSMKDLETHARGVGMSMTGYQGLQRQLQLGGMSPEDAKKTISQISDLNLEIQHYGAENAPTTRRVLQNVSDPATFRYLSEMMKQMEGAPIEKQINLINEALENLRATMTKQDQAGGFEAARKEFLENLGLSPEAWAKVEEGTRVRRETAAPGSAENLRARTEETRKFEYESLKASFYWKDIGDSLAAMLLHGTSLNTGLGEMNTWLERIRDRALEFEKTWREIDFDHALTQLGEMEPAMKPFTDEIRNLVKDIKEIGTELKNIGDWLAQQVKKFAEPDVGKKIQRLELEREGWSDEQIDKYLKEHPGPEDKQPFTWEDYKKWWHGGKEPEPSKPPYDPQEYLRRKFGPRGVPEEQIREYERQHATPGNIPLEQRDPMTGLPYEESPAPPPAEKVPAPPAPAPTPPPPAKTPDWYKRKMERLTPPEGEVPPRLVQPEGGGPIIVPERERSLFDFQPTPQRPDVGQGEARNLDPSRFTKFPGSSRIEDIRPPGGGPFRSKFDPPTYSPEEMAASEEAANASPRGRAYWKDPLEPQVSTGSPLDKLSEGVDKHLRDFAAKQKSTDARGSVPRIAGPWHQGQNEKQETEESFSNRFGVWPGMGAEKIDQASSKLDQAANTNVNISGAGKIRVDVNAPPGTSVDASGEGFFKSTEITRMTSMLPADFGPGPVTGISTGQGASANGTATA
jgi:hypothetical protein